MAQFDLFDNPITRARKAFPFVVVLQADLANKGHKRIVAPLGSSKGLVNVAGRMTPRLKVGGAEHVLYVHDLFALPETDLRTPRGNLATYRDDIVAAIDYLFLGI